MEFQPLQHYAQDNSCIPILQIVFPNLQLNLQYSPTSSTLPKFVRRETIWSALLYIPIIFKLSNENVVRNNEKLRKINKLDEKSNPCSNDSKLQFIRIYNSQSIFYGFKSRLRRICKKTSKKNVSLKDLVFSSL